MRVLHRSAQQPVRARHSGRAARVHRAAERVLLQAGSGDRPPRRSLGHPQRARRRLVREQRRHLHNHRGSQRFADRASQPVRSGRGGARDVHGRLQPAGLQDLPPRQRARLELHRAQVRDRQRQRAIQCPARLRGRAAPRRSRCHDRWLAQGAARAGGCAVAGRPQLRAQRRQPRLRQLRARQPRLPVRDRQSARRPGRPGRAHRCGGHCVWVRYSSRPRLKAT